jgi:hypothetical protein
MNMTTHSSLLRYDERAVRANSTIELTDWVSLGPATSKLVGIDGNVGRFDLAVLFLWSP